MSARTSAYTASHSTSVVPYRQRGDQRRREDAVLGLGERGVPVPEEAVELGAGRLEQDQVLDARGDDRRAVLHVDRGGANPAAVADEGVVVAVDAVPGVLLDLDQGAGDGRGGVDEVTREAQGVVLDRSARRAPSRTRRRCSSGCRSAGRAAWSPVVWAASKDPRRWVETLRSRDLVASGVPVDPHDPVLRLAVLVRAEANGHVSSLGRWSR